MVKEIDVLVQNKIPLPAEAKRWIESKFPVYIFKSKRVNEGQPITSTNRLDWGSIVNKQLRLNTRLKEVNCEYLEVTLAKPDRIEIQLWYITQSFTTEIREYFEYQLINLEVLKDNKHHKGHFDSTMGCYVGGLKQLSGMNYHISYYVYREFNEAFIKNSPLKYIEFPNNDRAINVQHIYMNRNLLEMLQKSGMNKMFKEVFEGRGFDKRTITKFRLIHHRSIIAKYNLGIDATTLYIRMVKVNQKVLPFAISYFNQDNYKRALKHQDLVKLQKYLVKQNKQYSYYLDYQQTMIDIGTPADSEQTLYPKDLVKTHDEAAKKLEVKKNIPLQKQYQKRISEILELEYQGKKYAVVIPKEISEISIEGKVLEHCVGNSSYLKLHAKGKTNILFVRSIEKIDEPLYTVEYKNKKIVQYHGYKNRDSENKLHKEVESFLFEEWLPERKKQ